MIKFNDNTFGAMVVCDSSDQAKEMYQNKCGFIINNSLELIRDIVMPQFQDISGTNERYKIKFEVEKNIKQYINEKGISSEKIYKLINEYA